MDSARTGLDLRDFRKGGASIENRIAGRRSFIGMLDDGSKDWEQKPIFGMWRNCSRVREGNLEACPRESA